MLLSIVIPAHNEAADNSLPRLMRELAAEDLDGVGVVVVDDFSDDSTLEVARAETVKMSSNVAFHFSALRNKKRGYCGGARNFGIGATDGEYVWCLDADAHITPGAVAMIKAALQGHPDMLVMGTNGFMPDGNVAGFSVTASTHVIRRDLYAPFREDWGYEDVDWWVRQLDVCDITKCVCMEVSLTSFQDENMSASINLWRREEPFLWEYLLGHSELCGKVDPRTPGAFLRCAAALVDLKARQCITNKYAVNLLDQFLGTHLRYVRRMFRRD